MLEINNYAYAYEKNKYILEKLNLKVNNGEILALVGPNGAGKTTLIKSLVGINLDFEGEVIFEQVNLKKDDINYKKLLGYVADEPMLIDYLTGRQYLNFIADVFEISMNDRKKKMEKYINLFNLQDFIDSLINTYSHGNKQKLVIVAALIHSPKLLILDEPFVGLDPQAIVILKDILKNLRKSRVIVVFSTHLLAMIEGLYDKVLFMNNKRVQLIENNKALNLEKKYMEFIESV